MAGKHNAAAASHEKNITKLIEHFGGKLSVEEIRSIYDGVRIKLQTNATVKNFLAIVTFRQSEEIIMRKIKLLQAP
ncbi:MAG: hypothetical protein Q8Q39_02565 [bacterium]|nr:hypothetical protein [bacterium]